jgi:uncharacterized protein (DUF934 family)
MALINRRAQTIEDGWSYPDAAGVAPIGAKSVIPLDVLVAVGSETVLDRPIGMYAAAGVTAEQIVPFLDMLDLVVVEFPKFRDGRGFTVARTLRQRHGFKRDIRAIGHVLPDRFAALLQCGFSTIVTPAEHPPEQWLQSGASRASSAGPLLQRLIGARAAAPGKLAGDEGDTRPLHEQRIPREL